MHLVFWVSLCWLSLPLPAFQVQCSRQSFFLSLAHSLARWLVFLQLPNPLWQRRRMRPYVMEASKSLCVSHCHSRGSNNGGGSSFIRCLTLIKSECAYECVLFPARFLGFSFCSLFGLPFALTWFSKLLPLSLSPPPTTLSRRLEPSWLNLIRRPEWSRTEFIKAQ